MDIKMFTCPNCHETYTMGELVNEWGYDAGDFYDVTVPEPEPIPWDIFLDLTFLEWAGYVPDGTTNLSDSVGYPIGQVGI